MSFGPAENMLRGFDNFQACPFCYSRTHWHALNAQLHYLRRLIAISAVKQKLRWVLL